MVYIPLFVVYIPSWQTLPNPVSQRGVQVPQSAPRTNMVSRVDEPGEIKPGEMRARAQRLDWPCGQTYGTAACARRGGGGSSSMLSSRRRALRRRLSSCRSGGGGCGGRSGRSGCYPVGLVRGGRGGRELVGELQNELLLWAEEVILVRARLTKSRLLPSVALHSFTYSSGTSASGG